MRRLTKVYVKDLRDSGWLCLETRIMCDPFISHFYFIHFPWKTKMCTSSIPSFHSIEWVSMSLNHHFSTRVQSRVRWLGLRENLGSTTVGQKNRMQNRNRLSQWTGTNVNLLLSSKVRRDEKRSPTPYWDWSTHVFRTTPWSYDGPCYRNELFFTTPSYLLTNCLGVWTLTQINGRSSCRHLKDQI